jgi:hypothetical protein
MTTRPKKEKKKSGEFPLVVFDGLVYENRGLRTPIHGGFLRKIVSRGRAGGGTCNGWEGGVGCATRGTIIITAV